MSPHFLVLEPTNDGDFAVHGRAATYEDALDLAKHYATPAVPTFLIYQLTASVTAMVSVQHNVQYPLPFDPRKTQ